MDQVIGELKDIFNCVFKAQKKFLSPAHSAKLHVKVVAYDGTCSLILVQGESYSGILPFLHWVKRTHNIKILVQPSVNDTSKSQKF